MNAYRIVVRKSVLRDIRRFPSSVVTRLRTLIESLALNPFPNGVKKIQGHEGSYRVRVGDYRIVYEVAREIRIITIVKVGHRRDVYRRI